MFKTILQQKLEAAHGAPLEELIRQWAAEGLSREQMARRLDVSYWTLTRWLDDMGARFSQTVTFEKEAVK